jgi:hypothetical protein
MSNLIHSSDTSNNPMAAVAIQRVAAVPRQNPTFKPIIEQASAGVQNQAPAEVDFDPKKHLAYTPPSQIIQMSDIGYPEDVGVSPVAVSQPFQLFSKEAIQQMRAEIFKPEVLENCGFSSNIAACQLRGYAPKYAPFTHEAWHHPDVLAIISKIAGVDLVPEMDYEVAHINLSVKSDEQSKEEMAIINKQKRFFDDDEGIGGCENTNPNFDHTHADSKPSGPWEDDKPVVGWHHDSYPFVCVLMLSDCTGMVGGETALRTADGEILKVRGPQEGCAVVLQGRYITHQALRALGAKERITAVTSFRPRSPHIKDDSVLDTVRPISDLSSLYYGFAEYRLEMMEERIRKARKDMTARQLAGKKFDTAGHKKFLEESVAFMGHTNHEVVEDSKVIPGFIQEVDLPDAVGDTKDERPAKRVRLA